ncbi:HNH endonuclease [Dictyobacter arantiisoli]|uniref:Uncharacterized protein n=1 Tax=Dictyobacter arantiisoli TaxID=2014874 RepID=A0A5A5TJJ2_9CHLR|nr:HNH endonuclease [Dictyobacter arantiisoli]GCF11415.1 hypothetical protein KDI_49790 [Dictyobacter arantiisoli]
MKTMKTMKTMKRQKKFGMILSLLLLTFVLAGCTVTVGNGGSSSKSGNGSSFLGDGTPTGGNTSSNGSGSSGGSSSTTIGQRTKTSGCQIQGAYQDKQCTPGAIFPNATKAQICVSGYSSSVRNVPTSEKTEVYREYGIMHHTTGQYEVDHLISLELGGSNDIANLWPEAASPTPGFHQKDQVENYLHDQVCSGKISLKTAQGEIANDWLTVYKNMH